MTVDEKQRLVDMLAETHASTRSMLEGIDLETPVFEDTGWRIREILGHLAVWDREVVRSLRAYRDGGEYFIPNLDEDDYNERVALEQRSLSSELILAEWEKARESFRREVEEMPEDQFPGYLLYPWGDESGDIGKLVEYMCEHDEEHHADIMKAIRMPHQN